MKASNALLLVISYFFPSSCSQQSKCEIKVLKENSEQIRIKDTHSPFNKRNKKSLPPLLTIHFSPKKASSDLHQKKDTIVNIDEKPALRTIIVEEVARKSNEVKKIVENDHLLKIPKVSPKMENLRKFDVVKSNGGLRSSTYFFNESQNSNYIAIPVIADSSAKQSTTNVSTKSTSCSNGTCCFCVCILTAVAGSIVMYFGLKK